MSIFSSIKDAIFGHKAEAATTPAPTTAQAPAPSATPASTSTPASPFSDVYVVAKLATMPGADALNWRTSIVDLMKLLGIDPSLANREALAKELGYTGALDGSAEMNLWLHSTTMTKLAENGGEVPADMRN